MSLAGRAALGAAVLLLAGCGGGDTGTTESSGPPPLKPAKSQKVGKLLVTLAGRVGPESAGLVMAERRGYFADEGLDVELLASGSPLAPVKYVYEETDDLGVTHQPQVELAQDKGAPLVTFGSVIPRPTAALMWPKGSDIHGIADLKGKTIAIPGLSFQRGLLDAILERGGVSPDEVKIKAVEYELVSSLAYGQADAIFGGSANIEAIELESEGIDPVVVPVSSLGIPPYEELVLIARTDFAQRYPTVIRKFMAAVRRGTAAAIAHPRTAARLIEEDPEAPFGTGREEMRAEVEATLPLLSRSGKVTH